LSPDRDAPVAEPDCARVVIESWYNRRLGKQTEFARRLVLLTVQIRWGRRHVLVTNQAAQYWRVRC
jgi:hypothetical protein